MKNKRKRLNEFHLFSQCLCASVVNFLQYVNMDMEVDILC